MNDSKARVPAHRLCDRFVPNGEVTFMVKDYRNGGKKHPVTLTDKEFIRRFSQYIPPKGFPEIRYYGILSSIMKNKITLENRV